jgi:hypothetical protein
MKKEHTIAVQIRRTCHRPKWPEINKSLHQAVTPRRKFFDIFHTQNPFWTVVGHMPKKLTQYNYGIE